MRLSNALLRAVAAFRRPQTLEVDPEPGVLHAEPVTTATLLVAQEGLPAQLPRLIPLRRDRRAAWREFVKVQKQAKRERGGA